MFRLPRTSFPFRGLVAPVVLAAIGVGLVLLTGSMAQVCPAVFPAPASCSADSRRPWVVAGLVIILIALLATGFAVLTDRRVLIWVGAILLGVASIAFPVATAFSGGFGIDPVGFVLAAVALGLVASLTIVIGLSSRGLSAER